MELCRRLTGWGNSYGTQTSRTWWNPYQKEGGIQSMFVEDAVLGSCSGMTVDEGEVLPQTEAGI